MPLPKCTSRKHDWTEIDRERGDGRDRVLLKCMACHYGYWRTELHARPASR